MNFISPLERHEKLGQLAQATAHLNHLREMRECEGSLYKFLQEGWQFIDPAEFVGGWHLGAIAEHLEAVSKGHIKRLLINCPPRMSKSSVVAVAWPAWTWALSTRGYLCGPKVQFLYASYAEKLSLRDSVKTRRLIESPWYQKHWGKRFRLTGDQNTKIRFENDAGGYRLATSVGGTITGEGGSILVIDDAHKADEVESDVVRQGVIDWWDEVFTTRLNDPKLGAIVVIGQRVHQEDISGHLLESGEFTHLCLPMEYDSKRHCVTVIGMDELTDTEEEWDDPRTEEAELLCEGRYGLDELQKFKKNPFVWAGQFQQIPIPKGGAIIKEDYWQWWDEKQFPTCEYILASLDTAYTAKEENDASALTIWGVFRDIYGNPKIILLYAWQERLEFNQLIQKVIDTCTVDGRVVPHARFKVDRLLIEAKASGISVSQELHRMFSFTGKFGIELINPTRMGDKVARVHAIVHLFSEGMIWAPFTKPHGYEWVNQVVDQCASFPKSSRDDLVDSTSQALRYLRDQGFALRSEEHRLDVDEEMMYRPKNLVALYPC